MLTDPGHIAANAAKSGRRPCYKVEVCWDGTNWTDESQYLQPNFHAQLGLVDPFEGLISMGSAGSGRATLRFANDISNGRRFSQDYPGSQAATYGIYGKKVRLSTGFYHGATPETVTVWTGRFMAPVDKERAAIASIECHDMGSIPMQQKQSTMLYAGVQTNGWIQTLANLAGITATNLERGLITLPYAYLDDDFAMDEIRRAAAAEGGVAFFDASGTLRFWNAAHWCNATSVATFTVSDFAELEPKRAYNDIYNVISVEYQPRQAGQTTQVYRLERAITVPPGGSKEVKLKLNSPLLSFTSYELSACSGGGDDMTADVSVAPTGPDAAASWTATFSNANTRQAAFITRFDVYGVPIEGRPAETYEIDESGSDVPRRRDIRGNWYIQTEAQAKLIASILSQRFKALRLSMVLRGAPANPLLELGDVVTVQATRTGINRTAIITTLDHRGGKGYLMDIGLSDFTDFYTYSGYMVVGTSALGASGGRLFL